MISKYQQRRRAYTNVLLFVGLIAMAMVAWLDYKNRLPDRRPASTMNAAPASLVAFVSAKGVNTEIRRQGKQWSLTMPVQLSARVSRVSRLLELQAQDFSAGFDTADVNLDAAKLDASARLLQLDEALYRFGGFEPVSGKRYIQLADKVLLLEDRYLPLMDGGINAFAELQLPFQQVNSATVDDTAINDEQLLAWQNTQAMGVRAVSSAPGSHKLIDFSEATAPWLAWPEKGLWVLQPQQLGVEYLINSAQAATLGLN